MKKKSIALIPARSNSKRLQNKNIKPLAGHPLLAYSVRAAIESNVFDTVLCATDSNLYADIAKHYGAEVPFLRPAEISGDFSPDIEWVHWVLQQLKSIGRDYEIFSILRPTNPFRLAETIQRAWDKFLSNPTFDSLRAVEKCNQHPGKMWVVRNGNMLPLMPFTLNDTPWHSTQYAALPEIYIQNASLEISWSHNVLSNYTISGDIIMPFESKDLEGVDINQPEDWILAEYYYKNGIGKLQPISCEPFKI